MPAPLKVFVQFFVLGLTSFGGPVAHLGYFHERFVQRERWICLLYTSPSPRDLSTSRMPSSA